jgi:hypothetical protein
MKETDEHLIIRLHREEVERMRREGPLPPAAPPFRPFSSLCQSTPDPLPRSPCLRPFCAECLTWTSRSPARLTKRSLWSPGSQGRSVGRLASRCIAA